MTKKYLDYDGLSRYDSKIKEEIPTTGDDISIDNTELSQSIYGTADYSQITNVQNGFEIITAQMSENTDNISSKAEYSDISYLEYTFGLGTDTYDSSKTYNKGDLCIKNRRIFECNTNGTTGTWNSSKWDIVPIIVNE